VVGALPAFGGVLITEAVRIVFDIEEIFALQLTVLHTAAGIRTHMPNSSPITATPAFWGTGMRFGAASSKAMLPEDEQRCRRIEARC